MQACFSSSALHPITIFDSLGKNLSNAIMPLLLNFDSGTEVNSTLYHAKKTTIFLGGTAKINRGLVRVVQTTLKASKPLYEQLRKCLQLFFGFLKVSKLTLTTYTVSFLYHFKLTT